MSFIQLVMKWTTFFSSHTSLTNVTRTQLTITPHGCCRSMSGQGYTMVESSSVTTSTPSAFRAQTPGTTPPSPASHHTMVLSLALLLLTQHSADVVFWFVNVILLFWSQVERVAELRHVHSRHSPCSPSLPFHLLCQREEGSERGQQSVRTAAILNRSVCHDITLFCLVSFCVLVDWSKSQGCVSHAVYILFLFFY